MPGENDELNYSLGVLIVLLMVFWFLCKCIGNSSHTERLSNTNLYYGNTPVRIGSTVGVHYIAERNGIVEVPNSKTAMRHLFEDDVKRCTEKKTEDDEEDETDQGPSTMLLKKNSARESFVNKGPRSLTSTRGFNNVDRTDFVAMAPY